MSIGEGDVEVEVPMSWFFVTAIRPDRFQRHIDFVAQGRFTFAKGNAHATTATATVQPHCGANL